MKKYLLTTVLLCITSITWAQNVSISAVEKPAAEVIRTISKQTGKNFVYSSPILKDLYVTVNAKEKSLNEILDQMFKKTDIEWKIKGNNIILKKKAISPMKKPTSITPKKLLRPPKISSDTITLDEVVIVSRLESPATETSEIGSKKLTPQEINRTPALLGESDAIKTLHNEPGVTAGVEGLADMHVHGGESDENLYMLDNAPLYQVNHLGGLFSAFNTEAIRYADFFKSSIPAKYD